MAQTDNLHELILTLSQNEKRYFKIYCDRHVIGEESQSALLFDMVASQDVYDSDSIMKKLSFVNTPDRLKKKKHQVHRLLLKCMAYYHSEENSDLRLLEVAQQVQFLYRKGLYRQCIRLLDKAEDEARKLEKHSVLVVLLECRRRVLHRLADADGVQLSVQNIRKTIELHDADLNLMEYSLSILQDVNREGVFRSQEEAELTGKKLSGMEAINTGDSFLAQYYRISAQSIYYTAASEHSLHMQSNRSLVKLFRDNPHFIADWPSAYALSLRNLCNGLFAIGRMTEHRKVLAMINELKNSKVGLRDHDFRNQLEVIIFEHGLLSAIYAGNFANALKLVDGFIPHLEGSGITETSRVQLLYDIGYLYFIIGDFKKCQKFINRLLLDESAKSRNDLIGFAELMNIILHFEREHDQLTEYLERSLKRRLISDDRLYPAERIILRLLKQIANEPDRKIFNQHLVYAISKFEVMTHDPYERDVWQYFDFISWLEAKRDGRRMQDVFKERMSKLWKR